MNKDDARRLGQALADHLPDEGPVVVATDASSANAISDAYIEGLRLQGRDVLWRHNMTFEDAVKGLEQSEAAGGAYITSGSVVMMSPGSEKLPVDTVMMIMQMADEGNFVPAKLQGSVLDEPPTSE